jgi:hypothetical protein
MSNLYISSKDAWCSRCVNVCGVKDFDLDKIHIFLSFIYICREMYDFLKKREARHHLK